MKYATALVHVPQATPSPASSTNQRPLPFDGFLRHVAELTSTGTGTDLAGAAVWSGLPIEDLIVDGLWPLMKKIATLLGRQLHTEMNALELAHVVEDYVNIGLDVCYPSLREAANAFHEAVIVPSMQALRRLTAPVAPAMVWAEYAAQFFARLTKRVRVEAAKWYAAHELLTRRNVLHAFGDAMFVVLDSSSEASLYDLAQDVHNLSRYRPTTFVGADHTVNARCMDFRKAKEECAERGPVIDVLRRIPYVGLPSDIPGAHSDVEAYWINTQVHLVSARLPDRDYVKLSETMQVVNASRTLDPANVASGFIARMRTRGWRPSPADVELLRTLVTERAASQRNISFRDLGSQIPMYLLHDRLPDGVNAIDVISDDEGLVLAHDASGAFEAGVQWSSLTLSDLEHLLDETDLLETETLLRGIAKMPPALRAGALKIIKNRQIFLSADDELLLVQLGLEDATLEQLAKNRSLLSAVRFSRAFFVRLFGTLGELSSTNSITYPVMCELLNLAPKKLVRELAADPETRGIFACFVGEITDMNEASVAAIADQVRRLRETVGETFWTKAILQNAVYARREAYRDKKPRSARILPWAEQSVDELTGDGRLTPERARAAIRKYSEEDLLRWMEEDGTSKNRSFVEEFIASRDAYYAAQTSPPAKKRPRAKRPRS